MARPNIQRLRPVSGSNVLTEDVGASQLYHIPINGLGDAGGIAVRGETIYVSDQANHVIYRTLKGGTSQIFAGAYGVSGNADGQNSAARFNAPTSICVDAAGTLWIVDSGNSLIRKMTDSGKVFTVATVTNPGMISVDQAGIVYLATA